MRSCTSGAAASSSAAAPRRSAGRDEPGACRYGTSRRGEVVEAEQRIQCAR